MQGPAVEKLAEEGHNVGKINVDDEGELAERYRVMNIPTLIIFKNGEEKERMVGVQSKEICWKKQIKGAGHKALHKDICYRKRLAFSRRHSTMIWYHAKQRGYAA